MIEYYLQIISIQILAKFEITMLHTTYSNAMYSLVTDLLHQSELRFIKNVHASTRRSEQTNYINEQSCSALTIRCGHPIWIAMTMGDQRSLVILV